MVFHLIIHFLCHLQLVILQILLYVLNAIQKLNVVNAYMEMCLLESNMNIMEGANAQVVNIVIKDL